MNIRNFNDFKSFLFENKTIKQTIFKNTFWLAIAEGTSKFLKLILLIYVARILGATEYGKFTFALAFVSLFVIFSNFGLSRIVTREFARKKEKEKEFASIFSLKVLLSLGTLILILGGSYFITSDLLIQKLIWILAVYILVYTFSEIIYAFLEARQQMQYESLAKILQAVLITGASFFVLFNFPSVKNLSYGYLFASIITLISILLFFHFKIFPLKISFEKSIWKKFLLMSWPLALGGIFATICSQIDSVMMGHLGMITETGWYNASYKIAEVILLPAGLISASFYPFLSKFFSESREKLQNTWNHYMKSIIFLAAPLVMGGIVLAPRIIDFIYGPDFNPSILAFQILIVMTGIMLLNSPFNQALIISNQQEKTFWIVLSGAITNIILNLILIPMFSLYGAAVASLITFLLIFFLLVKFTLKFTSIRPFNFIILSTIIGAIFSSGIMYFIISQSVISRFNVLFLVLIGAIVYSVSFFIVDKISIKTYKINRRRQI